MSAKDSDNTRNDPYWATRLLSNYKRLSKDPTPSAKDLDLDNIGNNQDLAALMAHLEVTAPRSAIDPEFRNHLLDALLDRLPKTETPEATMTTLTNLLQEPFPTSLVQEIFLLLPEERTALLTYIANHTHANPQYTLLQQAFVEKGIRLQDYLSLLPSDPLAYIAYKDSLKLACKRIAKLYKTLTGDHTRDTSHTSGSNSSS